MRGGRYFLHDHLASDTSWRTDVVQRTLALRGAEAVVSHMCRFVGLRSLVKKATRFISNSPWFISNSPCIRNELTKTCNGDHKRPPLLCKAVHRGIREQLRVDKYSEILSIEAVMRSDVQGGEQGESYFWDDVNGGELPAAETKEAREKEMQYVRRMKVYDKVPYEQSMARIGKKPIKLKWVDTRKGTGEVRSRLVAKEFKTGSCSAYFSPTPPLEVLKLILSLVASSQKDSRAWGACDLKEYKYTAEGRGAKHEKWLDDNVCILHTDISRAYFHAKAVEEKYVELPAEDWEEGSERQCGRFPYTGPVTQPITGKRHTPELW